MSVPARSAHPAPRHGCSSRPWLEALPPAYRILSAAESRSTPKAALVSMRTLSCWSARHQPRSCAAPLARRTCGRMHRGRAARSRRLPDPHLNAKQPQGALAGAVDIELLGSARLQPVETLGTGRVDRRHVRVVAVGLDDRHAAANLPQDVPGHRGGRAHGRHTAADQLVESVSDGQSKILLDQRSEQRLRGMDARDAARHRGYLVELQRRVLDRRARLRLGGRGP